MDRHRTVRARRASTALALASAFAMVGGACDAQPPPTLGISTSARYVDAARLALTDAEVAGRIPVDTAVIPEATNEATAAVGAADRFVGMPGILAVIGHSNSAASLAASQIYNRHGVVQIAPHSSAVVYSRAGPWSFRLVPPDDAQAAFLAEAVDSLLPGGGRVAVLYVNDDYGRGLLSDFVPALDPESHPIVLEYPHMEEEGQQPGVVRSTVDALEGASPDLLVWLGRGTVLHAYLPSIRERLPGTRVLGGDALASAEDLATADDLPVADDRWDGVVYVDFVDMDATPEVRDFARRYEERFGVQAAGPDALTYDAAGLVLAAVREGARTPGDLRAFLMSLGRERPPYQGVTGPVRFDDDGDADRSYVLVPVGGGS